MNDKLQPTPQNNQLTNNKKKPGLPAMFAKQQIAASQAKAQEAIAVELPNRIGLLLDVSGSMGGQSISDLRIAYDSFVSALNFSDTSLTIAHFGYPDDAAQDVPLTTDKSRIVLVGMGLHAMGGTPMASAMERVINSQPVTRCVLISDGDATGADPIDQANTFKEAGVPCDCVHISTSIQGEETLKKIAEITGGIYIKFDNTGNFAKFFSFLTPVGRLRLMSGDVNAEGIGAKEIKFLGGFK